MSRAMNLYRGLVQNIGVRDDCEYLEAGGAFLGRVRAMLEGRFYNILIMPTDDGSYPGTDDELDAREMVSDPIFLTFLYGEIAAGDEAAVSLVERFREETVDLGAE